MLNGRGALKAIGVDSAEKLVGESHVVEIVDSLVVPQHLVLLHSSFLRRFRITGGADAVSRLEQEKNREFKSIILEKEALSGKENTTWMQQRTFLFRQTLFLSFFLALVLIETEKVRTREAHAQMEAAVRDVREE